MTSSTSPLAQQQYQVRFDWGLTGARVVGHGADVVVWVDALRDPDAPAEPAFDDIAGTVVAGSLRNRTAVADWVLARQTEMGARCTVAVIAAGSVHDDGSARFAVEDLLAAGAMIDALAALGIDHCAPEAAAASASFTGLRNATRHLIGASGTGQQLIRAGHRAQVDLAIALDASSEVETLREFTPPA